MAHKNFPPTLFLQLRTLKKQKKKSSNEKIADIIQHCKFLLFAGIVIINCYISVQ